MKYRFIALFICLVFVLGMTAPALAADDDQTPATAEPDASGDSAADAPETSGQSDGDNQTGDDAQSTDPVQPATVQSARPDLYDELIACQTQAEVEALLSTMSEEDLLSAESALTDEQRTALSAHFAAIAPAYTSGATTVYTAAGAFMAAVNVDGASGTTPQSGAAPDGLVLSQTAQAGDNGQFTIRLEAYTTGKVTSSDAKTPVDIVLVLDQSASMACTFAGESTSDNTARRQYAVKQAVSSFIADVSEKYDSSKCDHRIAIVTYADSAETLVGWTNVDSSGKTALQNAVNGLADAPTGSARADKGMSAANTLINSAYSYTGSNTSRQKVVIFFTCGVTGSSAFDTDVANSAIAAAKSMKDNGVTVYSVGIFAGANPGEMYGTEGFDTNSDGSVSSNWTNITFGLLTGAAVQETARPAANRFANLISGNYAGSTGTGLAVSTSGSGILYYKDTYEITQNFSRSYTGYYLTANNAGSLNTLLQSIGGNIQTADIAMGSGTVVKNTVSQYFDLPENASDIKVYTADANSDGSFGDETDAGLTAQISGNAVSVSGFDFDANYVSSTQKGDGSYGKKLIIEFTVTPKSGFIGGNDVPANDRDKTGVYDNSGAEIGKFASALTVNVPIEKPSFTVYDKTIYEGNSTAVSGLYNLPSTGGWQYDYVKVTSGVKDVDGSDVSPADCTEYTVKVTYAPKTDGAGSAGTANAMSGVYKEKKATVHVLKPVVSVTVSDVQKCYGETYTLGDGANGTLSLTWEDKTADHTSIPEAGGTAPYAADVLSLTYSSDAFAGQSGTVPKNDFDVTVKVMNGDTEVADAVISTSCAYGCDAYTDGKYTVHVETCTLTITMQGGADNELHVFSIYKDGKEYSDAAIIGNGTLTLTELPVGTYTIRADAGWNWRYDADNGSAVKLSAASPSGSIICKNTKNNNQWLNGFSEIVHNIFGKH